MKKIIHTLALVFPLFVFGQSTDQNYVKSITYKTPTATSIPDPDQQTANISVTYFDGLGRPIEQIAHRQSASGMDIITPVKYDKLGRQPNDYLPVPSSASDMLFMGTDTAISDPVSYYATQFGSDGDYRSSTKVFEPSPLNRIIEQSAPGADWALPTGHTIKMDYKANAANEVVIFNAASTWNASEELYDIGISQAGYYPAGQLYKSIIRNENWTSGHDNTTEEFKDQEGHLVLKRIYNDGDPHDTYYVYDIYGNQTYVIPPLADISTGPSSDQLDVFCYQYKYDARNRMAAKKLPGKQWEYIIYDKLDRIIATGPVNSPFGANLSGWLITKYDVLGRVAYTCWQQADISDPGIILRARQAEPEYLYEQRERYAMIDGVIAGYSNRVEPTTGVKLMTVNYYDNYVLLPLMPSFPVTVEGEQAISSNSDAKGLQTGSWIRVLDPNDLTQAYANISYILYDSKARPIRTVLHTYDGIDTTTDTKLDFNGKTLYTITRHNTSPEIYVKDEFTYTEQDRLLSHTHQIGENGPIELLTYNQYDELGQLIAKKVGGSDLTAETFYQQVDYKYNIRGWLTDINNTDHLTQGGDAPEDLFAFKIKYQDNDDQSSQTNYGVSKLYNGNISETYWRTLNDNVLRKYGYEYDNLNRLTNAVYQNPERSNSVRHSYDESMSYDKNGNITHLERTGEYDDELYTLETDNLLYSYRGNKLMKVTDSTNDTNGFNDGANTEDEFMYDANGNMTKDANKKIASITYNHMNLPVKITISGVHHAYNKIIEYLYDANGVKLRKKARDLEAETVYGLPPSVTDYRSGFQYQQGILQFFPTAEGYVKNTVIDNENHYNYVYNYTDHIGNIRLSYGMDPQTRTLTILEENNFYPFGLQHKNYNWSQESYIKLGVLGIGIGPIENFDGYNYKYTGKERQAEFELNWDDYGARNYDAALGRWMNIDPLAEISRRYSPYVYALNNPVFFIDPDGMKVSAADNNYHEDREDAWSNMAEGDGDYYSTKGEYLGTDGIDDNKVYVGENQDETGNYTKVTDLGVTHNDFTISANVVKHESSGNKTESLWIAHTANNAKDNNAIDYKKKNSTLKDQLTDKGYSTTPATARTPLDDSNSSSGAKNARAAVIDVLLGHADPTGGAVLWDGSDFLKKGTTHNKFKEFKSVDIDAPSLSTYSSAQKVKANSVFADAIKSGGAYSGDGNATKTYALSSTGAQGQSLFWKIKK